MQGERVKPFSILLDKHTWAVLLDTARDLLGQSGCFSASPGQQTLGSRLLLSLFGISPQALFSTK